MLDVMEEIYTIERDSDELIDLIIIVDTDETVQKPTEQWQGMQ